MRINHTDLPIKASMGMLTQPISFLGLPVVTVPVKTASGLPIGVQIIAAPGRSHAACRRRGGWSRRHSLPTGSMMNRDISTVRPY
jgi:Asp-tRNA(Asn)/Glu-tRNA(Gln) amidotransferase A subunit family amidase